MSESKDCKYYYENKPFASGEIERLRKNKKLINRELKQKDVDIVRRGRTTNIKKSRYNANYV